MNTKHAVLPRPKIIPAYKGAFELALPVKYCNMEFGRITVDILKVSTGVVVTIPHSISFWEDQDNIAFTHLWEQGNFECDCNRAEMFGEEEEVPCSAGLYRVNLINPKDGKMFYQEWE